MSSKYAAVMIIRSFICVTAAVVLLDCCCLLVHHPFHGGRNGNRLVVEALIFSTSTSTTTSYQPTGIRITNSSTQSHHNRKGTGSIQYMHCGDDEISHWQQQQQQQWQQQHRQRRRQRQEDEEEQSIPRNHRRQFLISSIMSIAISSSTTTQVSSIATANAAETVGLDPDCNDRTCLGVWDGILADCPHNSGNSLNIFGNGAGCTSSQDDTPGIFAEPWDYSEARDANDWQSQMRLLRPTIELVSSKRGDTCHVVMQKDRYLRVLFQDKRTGEESIGEWYFTPNDTTVQFRIASTATSMTTTGLMSSSPSIGIGSQRNIDRAEAIRKELRYLKLPVLRNRKRSLLFVESDLDTFGPGSASLGPPAEMNRNDIDIETMDTQQNNNMYRKMNGGGGRLSDNVDPKLKIDFLQQFPIQQ